MTNRFLISVATAALITGTGLANAQGSMGRDSGAAGSTTQQSAPPSGAGASGGASGIKGAETTAPRGAEPGMKGAQSSDKPDGKMAPGKNAQDNRMQGEKSKSMSSEDSNKGDMKAGKDMKSESHDGKPGTTNAQGTTSTTTKSGTAAGESKSQTTTGNAATSATAAPPAEKRPQIVSAIRSEKIQETTSVNFNISVGTVIPAGVRYHPLPPRIVEIYPEWRGYEVILVKGRYVIVRPQTHEIVYIIEG